MAEPFVPALPWGALANQQTEEQEPNTTFSIETMGLKLGDRIEVKWTVSSAADNDESPISVIKWWGASLASCPEVDEDGPEHQYMLIYDSSEEFPEETAKVCFLSDHVLVHTETEDELVWRKQGDAYDVPSEEVLEEMEEEVVTTREICRVLEDPECSAAAVAAEQALLSQLNPAQQRIMASGMREFLDKFSEYVRGKQEREGPDVLITEADVLDFRGLLHQK